jgi:pimeloyl-ACP methyl ester carboxylesterase
MAKVDDRSTAGIPLEAFEEDYIEADGFRIRYRAAGQGDSVVCLHGAGGMRISAMHQLLAQQYRVMLLEAPGFGESPVNERSGTLQDLARTMGQAITDLGIERFHLMGTSFGGKLALWMAIQEPERLQSLILVSPAAIRPEGEPRVPITPEERLGLLYAHPERQAPLLPLDPAIAAKQEALVQRLIGPPRDEALESKLADLNVPVLTLFGTLDRAIPPEMGRIYREKLPNCHFVLVYDAGHAMDADRPEAVASIVSDFLANGPAFVVNRQSSLLHL